MQINRPGGVDTSEWVEQEAHLSPDSGHSISNDPIDKPAQRPIGFGYDYRESKIIPCRQ